MKVLPLRKNQKGIISFFVVMIIMIVLTLIVLAFSQLVRREQRQTLDRQLKSQALYAAESGVNEALDWLSDPANQDNLFTWNDECSGGGSFMQTAGLDNTIDSAGVISYSCLLVDPAPGELVYTVPTDKSAALRLQPQSGSISSLRISWTDEAGGGTVTGCPATGSYSGNGTNGGTCSIGTVRLELLPFNGPSARDTLINSRYVAYVQPRPGTGAAEVAFANGDVRDQGQSVGAHCSGGVCTVEIINIAPAISRGYMRIGSIYRSSEVTVEAFSEGNPSSSTTPLAMIGAQVEIDATGKANDVLHRVKVNAPIPVRGDGRAPEFGLQSRRHQCKRFTIAPPSTLNLIPTFGPLPAEECDPRI